MRRVISTKVIRYQLTSAVYPDAGTLKQRHVLLQTCTLSQLFVTALSTVASYNLPFTEGSSSRDRQTRRNFHIIACANNWGKPERAPPSLYNICAVYIYSCSTLRGCIKSADSTINSILEAVEVNTQLIALTV